MPFEGASRQALLTRQLTERPMRVSVHRREVSIALDELVSQLLEIRAVNRPSSATDVKAMLEQSARIR